MRDNERARAPQQNLLDAVERTLHAIDPDAFRVVPNLRERDFTDVAAITRDRGLAQAAAAALRDDPSVASVDEDEQRFLLRLRDEQIANTGAHLEAGELSGMHTDDLRAGITAIVDFCDPNATKALHVGHLRNIALGQAIAHALRAAGMLVQRQSHIGDAGRSMGEAMAGYQRYAAPEGPPQDVKSDHFVGELYARYVREEEAVADVAAGDAPVARDLDERRDLAQELLNAVEHGDPQTIELWRKVRAWAVDGQNTTLARLGVSFERIIYDSERTAAAGDLAQLGIERGVFVKEPRGTIAYVTGQDGYPVMPLTRADGFPTHHLRVVTMWRDMMLREQAAELIHLSGDEWKAHVHHVEQLLAKLEPEHRVLPSQHILHGMVASEQGGELSSSKGDATLIDALLDEMLVQPQLRGLASDCTLLDAEDLTAIAALGYCLDRPVLKGLVLPSPETLVDPQLNAAWLFAQAWRKAWDPANDGSPDPAPDEHAYRHIVLQAQLHRRNLAVALEGLDLLKYVRYVIHLSEWYLAREHPARVGRVMRPILAAGLDTLGLLRPRAARLAFEQLASSASISSTIS